MNLLYVIHILINLYIIAKQCFFLSHLESLKVQFLLILKVWGGENTIFLLLKATYGLIKSTPFSTRVSFSVPPLLCEDSGHLRESAIIDSGKGFDSSNHKLLLMKL